MNFQFENIHTRKVLVEKSVDFKSKDLYGMKFCSYKSNKESILIVEFCDLKTESLIRYNTKLSYGTIAQDFYPINIRIVESIDNNSSSEFNKWIEKSIQLKNTHGVDMFFFNLNSNKYSSVLSLRGCSLNSICEIKHTPIISVNFFAFDIPQENS